MNPVLGCFPEEAVETRDWMTQSSRTHTPLANPRMLKSAGRGTGVGGELPGSAVLGERFGERPSRAAAAAQRAAAAAPKPEPCSPHARGQSRHIGRRTPLRRPPTPAELDSFLANRSRARGLGGPTATCARTCDVVGFAPAQSPGPNRQSDAPARRTSQVQTKWSVLYSGEHRTPPNKR